MLTVYNWMNEDQYLVATEITAPGINRAFFHKAWIEKVGNGEVRGRMASGGTFTNPNPEDGLIEEMVEQFTKWNLTECLNMELFHSSFPRSTDA